MAPAAAEPAAAAAAAACEQQQQDESASTSTPTSALLEPQWVQDLLADPDSRVVLTAADLHQGHTSITKNSAAAQSGDHLFTSLLRAGLLTGFVSIFNAREATLCSLFRLGGDVCGHPGITHGGCTAAIIDESFGTLVYSLRDRLAHTGPAFTRHLSIDYRAPVPAGHAFACRCWCEEGAEAGGGRKVWVRAELRDAEGGGNDGGGGPKGGTLFAEGRALFLHQPQQPPQPTQLQ